MKLPASKTKIVCTIGPASESPELLEKMIQAGMDVARLNFSHGDFSGHREVIQNIRTAERALGRRVAIMADLPGPKMRIGQFKKEPVMLKPGNSFLLTTEKVLGDQYRVSSGFTQLPQVVKPGDRLFLKDGLIQLIVEKVEGNDVHCQIRVGGELRSRKGLNFPGINLGISAFTNRDRECLQFALDQGVDAVSQSFVETAADIEAVFDAASAMGHRPFVIAKIERAGALDHIDGILQVADGIMIARGDLGVEIPIEQIAVVQKRLMIQANLLGKPVITATQMLESMTNSRLPTRAEATDVANAVLDGTDCVMLSGESAMGRYPLESVKMLVKIAAAIEVHRPKYRMQEILKAEGKDSSLRLSDLIALSVQSTLDRVSPTVIS
ncbi:pyruvate kinase, partial [Thermodesulfobacteriota bacterium]